MKYGLRKVCVCCVSGGSSLGAFPRRFAFGGSAASAGSCGSLISSVWGASLRVLSCRVLGYSSRVRSVSFSVLASALRFGLAFPAQGLTLRSSGTAQKRAAP